MSKKLNYPFKSYPQSHIWLEPYLRPVSKIQSSLYFSDMEKAKHDFIFSGLDNSSPLYSLSAQRQLSQLQFRIRMAWWCHLFESMFGDRHHRFLFFITNWNTNKSNITPSWTTQNFLDSNCLEIQHSMHLDTHIVNGQSLAECCQVICRGCLPQWKGYRVLTVCWVRCRGIARCQETLVSESEVGAADTEYVKTDSLMPFVLPSAIQNM